MASGSSISPPPEAYRYWPTGDYIIKGADKRTQRFIFYQQSWTPFEHTKLLRLKTALQDKQIGVPTEWDDATLLRLMYGTGWKTRKSVEAVLKHLTWLSQAPPDPDLESLRLQPLLTSGCLYIHGRDSRYRPCIIMSYPKFNFKQYTIDDYFPLVRYLLDLVIEKMMIPGQVENWVSITDMGKMGLTDLPIGQIKRIIEVLQDNYKCRLGFNVIVNAPTTVNLLWTVVKKFMDKEVVEKMAITGKSTDPLIQRHFNPLQVEEKYGGAVANAVSYWPPIFPNGPYEATGMRPGGLLSDYSSYDTYHPVVEYEEVEIEEKQELYAVEEVEGAKEVDEDAISLGKSIEAIPGDKAVIDRIDTEEFGVKEAPEPKESLLSPNASYRSQEVYSDMPQLGGHKRQGNEPQGTEYKVVIDDPVRASWSCCGVQRCQKTSLCLVF